MGVASIIVAFLCLFPLLRVGSSQALPDLPDFPSASPVVSPSPSPGSVPEISNPSPSENVEPSPSRPPSKTNSPGAVPSGSMVPSSDSSEPTPKVSPNPSQPPQSGSQVSSSPSPSVSSSLHTNLDGACLRDEENPQPILGKSQLRYAISVLLSAGAVAFASVLYGLASDWDPEEVHAVYRLIWITVARILIFGAVKVSAALVASITKASPGDSALDASGAFLTWGSATFTRLYYEGFKMTMAALEFVDNNTVWDDKLREFLSVQRNSSQPSCLHEASANPDEGQFLAQERGLVNRLQGNLSLVQRIVGGNSERRLLLLTTILYFASEISVLTTNVFTLVGAFMENVDPDDVSFFASDENAEPCFSSKDAPIIFGLISLQVTYAFTQQPSLVPLLTVSAYCPTCEKYPRFNSLLRHLRWLASITLGLWVASLLAMPVLAAPLQPLFLAGDLSLFWYVIIAPPSYQSASYIVTASFTCLAAIVGTYIIYGISIDQRTSEADGIDTKL